MHTLTYVTNDIPPDALRGIVADYPTLQVAGGLTVRESVLLDRVIPPTWTASSPDPVTAWMAVAGSGLIPRKATFEAPVLLANRRSRRQPTARTRDSMSLSEKDIPGPVRGPRPTATRRS
jgi:hypothetical protein